MADSKLVSEVALSALASDIKAALALKANQATTYTKTETDNLLADKADKSDTYTKEETDNEVYNVLPTDTASGSIATFTDGGDNIPVKSFECEIVAQQGSGTPTPSSPLPISGFSQADIGDISDATNITYFKGVLEGKYGFVDLSTLSYTTASWGAYRASLTNAKLINNTTIFSGISENYTPVSYNNLKDNLVNNGIATSMSGGNALVYIVASASPTGYLIYELETPVTPTITSEQFASLCNAFGITGNAYIVEFGQTIYGGKLIYENGQWAIRATHEILTLNGTERISLTGTSTARRFRFDDTFTYNAIPLSSHFIESLGNSNPWGYYRLVTGYLLLTDNNSQMADETALKTWLANQYSGGTPVQFLCGLVTPVIIPITSSTRVKTISGLNNIYSNTGDCELVYRADIGLYIDKKLNP